MNAILRNADVISKMRGKWYEIEINNLKVNSIVSFHPAYLLRQPDQKKIFLDRFKNDKRKTKETLKSLKKHKFIAGVDEVGRGCLAGPVVSAAVIFKRGVQIKNLKD